MRAWLLGWIVVAGCNPQNTITIDNADTVPLSIEAVMNHGSRTWHLDLAPGEARTIEFANTGGLDLTVEHGPTTPTGYYGGFPAGARQLFVAATRGRIDVAVFGD